MAHRRLVSQLLWTLVAPVAVASAGCGRFGFDASDDSSLLEDAPGGESAVPVAELPGTQELPSVCGSMGSGGVPIRNTGGQPLEVTATASGGFVITSAVPFVVAPGELRSLVVSPPTPVIGTDRPGIVKFGALTLTTNEPDSPTYTVALTSTVEGAYVTATKPDGMPFSTSFDNAQGQCPAAEALQLTNTGTMAALITSPGSTETFSLDGFSSANLASGESTGAAIHVITSSACAGGDTLTFSISGPNCGPSTIALDLTFQITSASTCLCS